MEIFQKVFFATCSPPDFSCGFPVNNPTAEVAKTIDLIGVFNLFTACSPRIFGE